MNILGTQRLGQAPELLQIEFAVPSVPIFSWKIVLYHASKGFKKLWFIGQNNCPIEKIEFELNKRICGAGSITFAFLDFPLHADDYFEIYYNNSIKYRGFIENEIDPKGGKVKLLPYSQRYTELLSNSSFSAKTISEIFQTIVQAVQSDSDIGWNATFVNTGSTDTYSPDYSGYEYPKKIFDEHIKKLDDREWGVRPDNLFTVYQNNQTTDQLFFQTDSPVVFKVDVKRDYKKIRATRYQVFKKTSGSGEMARIGEVGYGGSYPILSLETIVRKKEQKFVVSEKITSDAEALAFAYADLTSQTIPQSISAEIDITQYFPEIGDKITIEDETEEVLKEVVDCESITNWTAGDCTITLDTTDYTKDSGSITFAGTGSPTSVIYDFGSIQRWVGLTRMGVMIKGTYAGDYLEISTGLYKNAAAGMGTCSSGICSQGQAEASDYLWETTYPLEIYSSSVWQWVDFEFTSNFQYIGIRFKSAPTASSTINIDQISIYCFGRTQYTSNIVQANFTIDQGSEQCKIKLNDYEVTANDEIFLLERNLEKIETVSTDT
jgi:hypothetical protein